MSNPKRHHFVPRLLVRNFANSDGRVWTYSKVAPEAGVRWARPEQVFVENELYTATSATGEKDLSLELAYSAIENKAAPVVEKIVAAGRSGASANLNREERLAWDAFFVAQMKRTPDFTAQAKFHEDYEKVLEKIVDEVAEERGVSTKEREAFFAEANSKKFRQNIKVSALSKPSPEVAQFVAECALVIIKIGDEGRSLVIGSNPAVKVREFGVAGPAPRETWMPLAPDISACMVSGSAAPGYFELSNDAQIREINMASYGNSTAVCGSSEQLVKSLVKAHRHLSDQAKSEPL